MKHTHDRSWSTNDRGPPVSGSARGTMLAVEQLGPRRERLHNGNLICYDVPIARTGYMLYGPGEVPVLPSPTSQGLYVQRTSDELFRPETVMSFYGAAIVDGHPSFDRFPEGVTPDNSKELAGGYATNVRPGKDGDEDVLLADLVFTRRDLIEAVLTGKREVSAGYVADYKTVRPGIGMQTNIIGNHIALVSKGRCGPRCAIGDHATNPTEEEPPMTAATTKGAPSGDRRRFDAATLDAIEGLVQTERRHLTFPEGSDDEPGIHVHVHTGAPTGDAAAAGGDDDDEGDARLTRLEAAVEGLSTTIQGIGESLRALVSGAMGRKKPTADGGDGADPDDEPGDDDDDDANLTEEQRAEKKAVKAKMTGDSAALAASYQDVLAKAEILVPGFRAPTFDSAAPRKVTVDSMCKLRTRVLDLFAATADGSTTLQAITGDSEPPDLDGMDCQAKAILFNAAAVAKGKANNARATGDHLHVARTPRDPVQQGPGRGRSIAEINDANKKHWETLDGVNRKA